MLKTDRKILNRFALRVAVALWAGTLTHAAAPGGAPPRTPGKRTMALLEQRGVASWYGAECAGRLMANGKKFDPDKLTCASWFFPLGTKLVVRYDLGPTVGSACVFVEVTDRGPARRLVARGRIIDLSRAAFDCLTSGFPAARKAGLISVTVEESAQ